MVYLYKVDIFIKMIFVQNFNRQEFVYDIKLSEIKVGYKIVDKCSLQR